MEVKSSSSSTSGSSPRVSVAVDDDSSQARQDAPPTAVVDAPEHTSATTTTASGGSGGSGESGTAGEEEESSSYTDYSTSDGTYNDEEIDMVSLDSYGLPRYERYYEEVPAAQGGLSAVLTVPWQLRKSDRRALCDMLSFLRVPQFWKQFEFAARITLIPVLVPAAIIASRTPHNPFVSPFMSISSTVLGAKLTVGEAIAYIFTWCRAGIFWLPLSIIAGATGMSHHMFTWCVYYTVMLVVMAVFTEAMVRRICLLLFNSCVVGLLMAPHRTGTYPCRVMVDWTLGTLLCTVAAFVPYPIFCKNHAQATLKAISRNTGTAFRGLVFSFWSPSNVERNMAMSKVRAMTESLDHLFPVYEHHQAFSFFEFLFESTEAREIRDLKQQFFLVLRGNLSSMTRVLDMVEASPGAIDNSERCYAFGEALRPHLAAVGEVFDGFMTELAAATNKQAVLALAPVLDRYKQRTRELQDAYVAARRNFFYEHAAPVLEEFVPLMTFYLFTIVCFTDTIEIFQMKLNTYQPNQSRLLWQIIDKVAVQPFMENVDFVRKLTRDWRRKEVQRVVEAAKVSGAMLLTIGFSFLMKIDPGSFSGPNIIAFVSGMNPVEAVQASIVRLTGCLIGTVLGFFAGTFSESAVERVVSLCVLMFVGTFLRNDKEYGVMAVYAMFVLIPLDSIMETTVVDTVARMNQNTFGIFIYLAISIMVFPLSPSLILRAKRSNILLRMSAYVTRMMDLFTAPLASERALLESEALMQHHLSNRSLHVMVRADEPLEELQRGSADIMRRMKLTKEFMGFAKDERGLVEVDYPATACADTYTHMNRMTVLLTTMRMSWNVLRCQRRYTSSTRRMLEHLQPIAHDIAIAFHNFSNLMCYMLKDPSVNLEQDVMKAVLTLIQACDEFSRRKSEIILILIHESVAPYRLPDDIDGSNFAGSATKEALGSPASAGGGGGGCGGSSSNRLASKGSLDAVAAAALAGLSPTAQSAALAAGKFRIVQSDKNVTLIPSSLHGDDGSSAPQQLYSPVHLPDDFQFPITSEDAEGLHSFSLCLEMFANETKLLMMSLGTMMDVTRGKM